MKIVVNDIAAQFGGAMNILKQFYNYVVANDFSNQWIFILGGKYLEEKQNVSIIVRDDIKKSKLKKLMFDLFVGKKFINKLKPDLVFSLQNTITFGVSATQIVYVHQSIPFQDVKKFSLFKKQERSLAIVQRFIGSIIKKSIKKATFTIVQTKWMKQAVILKTGVSNNKVLVAMPGIEKIPFAKCEFNNRRFFYPTHKEIYKNIECIVEACNELNKLGIYNFVVRLTLPKQEKIHPNVECVGSLDKKQMGIEYKSGTLLFPSYIETIGLPLIEAVSCNSMILASDTLFSRECLENYENYELFNPFDSRELANKMIKIIKGELFPKSSKISNHRKDDWDIVYKAITSLNKK